MATFYDKLQHSMIFAYLLDIAGVISERANIRELLTIGDRWNEFINIVSV